MTMSMAAVIGCVAVLGGGVGYATPDSAGVAESLAENLVAPWSVVPLGGGGALISERDTGLIREVTPEGAVRDLIAVPDLLSINEAGLLGLALAPESPGAPRMLYAAITTLWDNRIVRLNIDGEPGELTLTLDRVIFGGIPRFTGHNGGRIAFGPDGMLYVTTGDATVPQGAQSLAWLGGKILRLTPDGGVPSDNPFPGSPVYSLGHRNPQGLAWDGRGRMWASEFGQDAFDELNLIEPGGNYGWPEVEGFSDDPRFRNPVAVWTPAEASPSGIAAVGDTVYMAALRGQRLWTIDIAPDATVSGTRENFVEQYGRLRDVVVAPDGSLYLLTNNTDGRGEPTPGDDRILRVDPAAVA